MPPKKPIHATSPTDREDSLGRLRRYFEGENEDGVWEPEKEPTITPMLKAVEGGVTRVMSALRAHDDDDARDFMELYDSLSRTDRSKLTLEEIAHASGIGALRLAEIAQSALILSGQMASKLLLAVGLPKVVARSLKEAQTRGGIDDRRMMLQAGGVLPVPKGAQIAINTLVEGNRAESKQIESEAPVYLDSEQRLRVIHEAVEGQRRLPSPPSGSVAIGGRLDHIQSDAVEILRERE